MSEFIDPEAAVKKDTRRAWKFIIAAFVLVFGLFAGVMLFYDCPPSDDSSIMPKFTESPGGYNPLAVFLEEMKAIRLGDISKELSIEAMSCEKGTEEEIRGFLVKQSAPLLVFEKLIQTESSTWRWPGGEKRVSYFFNEVDYVPCQTIRKILMMKAHLETMDGKIEEAARTSLQIIKFGHGLEGSEGTMIENAVASTVSQCGKDILEEAVLGAEANSDLLAKVQLAVAQCELKKEGFVLGIKVQTLYAKSIAEALKNNPERLFGTKDNLRNLKVLFIKPNLTQAMAIYYMKPVIEGLEVSWGEGWKATQRMKNESDAFADDWFRFWVSPNACGNDVMRDSLPTYEIICERVLVNVCRTRQTAVMFALRRYELEQSRLPEKLEELAPRYLASVPVDPFTESAMLWNPEKKVIYSVGADGKDDGGRIAPKYIAKWQTFYKEPDVSMIYWWSEDAKKLRQSKDEDDAEKRESRIRADERAKHSPKRSKAKTPVKVPAEADQKK